MDPVTLWLLILATAAVVKSLAVDGWAKIHGRPPPSLEARRLRQEIAQKQHATTGTPGVGAAITDRLASRIANPPARRAGTEFREYLDVLLADKVADAKAKHEQKQRRRAGEPEPPPAPYAPPVNDDVIDAEVVEDEPDTTPPSAEAPRQASWPCHRGCGRTNPYPDTVCAYCAYAEQQAASRHPTWPPEGPPTEPIPVVQPESTERAADDTPATTAAIPATEGTQPMSQATVIDADINDPTGARRFTTANSTTLRNIADQYEQMAAKARAGKLGPAAVGEIEGMRGDILNTADLVDRATAVFDRHAAAQANVGSDDDLRGTVAGTYTDSARAS